MSKNKNNLFIRIITTPYRAICKAKNFYIRSITDCANHTNYGRAAETYGNPLSRSTSTGSFASSNAAAEDLRELIRANSTARMRDLNITRAEVDVYVKQHMMMKQSTPTMGSQRVGRSVSVGMGRIDEDAPVHGFAGDEDIGRKVKSDRLMFPRSRSHAVTSSNKFNRFS